MTAWFGGKKKVEETVLVLDIETGSVGSALVRISTEHAPKVFADNRVALPVHATLDSHKLLRATEKAAQEALLYTADVAGRLRSSTLYVHDTSQDIPPQVRTTIVQAGTVDRVVVFLSPPWLDFTPTKRSGAWTHEPLLLTLVRRNIEQTFGALPTTFYPLGSAIAETTHHLFEQPAETLFATLTGEQLELTISQEGIVHARATLPVGTNTLLRTLRTHGGLSLPEAHSALRLARLSRRASQDVVSANGQGDSVSFSEPEHEHLLAVAQQHLLSQFVDVADELLRFSRARTIIVVAPDPAGEWFARAFASEPTLLELFPGGASVRALHTHHLTPYLATNAPSPDLLLLLEALSVDNQHTRLTTPTR